MAKKEDISKVKLAEAPAGFSLNVGRERGGGWVVKAPGTIIQGRLLGRYLMKALSSNGEKRAYYQVRLAIPQVALFTPGEDDANYEEDDKGKVKRIEVQLQPGDIINVDEITALKDLGPYTRDGGVYNVWFQYIKQNPKQRNFWSIKGPSMETVRPAKHSPTPEISNGVRNLEDAPF